MVRQFNLVNEKGQKFSLMDIYNYCLLTDPTGLGYSYSTEYEQLNYEFIANLRKLDQGTISGTVNFISYDNFRNFVDFIETAKQLKFAYEIPFKDKNVTYYKDVYIKSLTKTEKGTYGIISEAVEFDCISLWYEQNETIFTIESFDDEMRYNYRWNSRYIDYNSRAIQYDNRGHIEAPLQVEIDGVVENPKITILVNDEEYASIEIPIKIGEYEKLLYSSKTGDIYIQKQNADGTLENLWKNEYIDITKQNIFKVPIDVSEIRLTATDDVLNAKVTIFPQYKVV